jgi:UDP-N-acetyl-D-galactosamine dehydrogenase
VLRNTPDVNTAKVLVKGVTFKENVSDIRNSKIIDTVKEIQSFNIQVDVEDPYAEMEEVHQEYGLKLSRQNGSDYDAVILATPHQQYLNMDVALLYEMTKPTALIADLKGIFKGKVTERAYWSL